MNAPRGAPLLRLVDVGVRFGAMTALRGVSLEVRRGEFIAVVGANGSGKTTLLRALHGLVPHTGRREVAPAAARQAMVFQRPFMLDLSVWHNVRLALWLAGAQVPRPERRARAERALARVGLLALRDRAARVLSGGEQQRLAFARAWALEPALLFLDEPTANLDPSAKKEIENLLASFAEEGMTLVMSTHSLGQARRLASRVVYVDQGTVRLDLPTSGFFGDAVDGRAERFLKGELSWSLD